MPVFYSTSYALTKGIEEVNGEEDGRLIRYNKRGYTQYLWDEGKHWHRTMEAAVKRAEEMKLAKISSLEESLAKLRKMSFNSYLTEPDQQSDQHD